jgi:hypothetical protein
MKGTTVTDQPVRYDRPWIAPALDVWVSPGAVCLMPLEGGDNDSCGQAWLAPSEALHLSDLLVANGDDVVVADFTTGNLTAVDVRVGDGPGDVALTVVHSHDTWRLELQAPVTRALASLLTRAAADAVASSADIAGGAA